MKKNNTSKQQPAREKNIATLITYFEDGIKENTRALGIELEHTVVSRKTNSSVSYSEEHGIEWLLNQLRDHYSETINDQEGDLLGLVRENAAITLEPAAQVELSAGPFVDLASAKTCFEQFAMQLDQVLAPVDKQALTLGYHPTTRALDLELIPKRRYKFMNLYLGAIGKHGPYMMRGSASTQISIDYSSVDDCLRKLRLAYALVPILSLISDNSPYFEGNERPHALMRTEIWRYCDPDRCGLIPNVMEPDFSLEKYAEYILDTPAILVPCKCNEWCYNEKTFGEIYAEQPMDRTDVEHALSMLFNDVRLKTYIEMRSGDAMPVPYVIAYAAFVKGLFYASENLDYMDELFAEVRAQDVESAKSELMEYEYEAVVYGRPIAELVESLLEAAHTGLPVDEKNLLDPLVVLAKNRTTLAKLALQKNNPTRDSQNN